MNRAKWHEVAPLLQRWLRLLPQRGVRKRALRIRQLAEVFTYVSKGTCSRTASTTTITDSLSSPQRSKDVSGPLPKCRCYFRSGDPERVQDEGGDHSIVMHLDRNSAVAARHSPIVIGIAQKLWRRRSLAGRDAIESSQLGLLLFPPLRANAVSVPGVIRGFQSETLL